MSVRKQPSSRSPRASSRTAEQEQALRRLDRLSYVMDNAIRLPGIDYRIGWDAVIGFIPGIGDAIGLAVASYIVIEAARLGVPRTTLARMTANVAVEAIVGTIPLAGDVFDATWKANARNTYLLREHLGVATRESRPRRGVGWALIGVLALLLGSLLYVVGLAIGALF